MLYTILLQSQDLPNDFFTLESMLTLTGATGAVFVVSSGIQYAFNFNPKWLALVIAQVLALVAVNVTNEAAVLSDYLVGIVNGFLIYSTAVGANQIGGRDHGQQATAKGAVVGAKASPTPTKRKFNSKWF